MSQLSFGIKISAQDDTKAGFRSALSGVAGFAKNLAIKPISIPFKLAGGGLAFLRDIRLGLAPLVKGIDEIVDRGASLEVVRKSFESLTGKTGGGADRLAQSIVKAANGTIRLAEAMQIANRALASGLGFDQLLTSMEFISKKAVSTGKDAKQALDTVITGLSRGSTLFLDDFGVLVDGLDGVKRAFDSIKGAGAFDALGPAAQKAETVRQAVEDMRKQMDRIGVTGKETVFVWQSIKNSIGGAIDKLVLSIAKSKDFQKSLTVVRDILAGLSDYFARGGSLKVLLFGDKGGGGVVGVIKSALATAAEFMGKGILIGMLKGIAYLIAQMADGLKLLKPIIEAYLVNPIVSGITQALKPLVSAFEWMKTEFKSVSATFRALFDGLPSAIKHFFPGIASGGGSSSGSSATSQPVATSPSTLQIIGRAADYFILRLTNAFNWWIGAYEFHESKTGFPAYMRDRNGNPWARGGDGPSGTLQVGLAKFAVGSAMGVTPLVKQVFGGIKEAIGGLAEKMRDGQVTAGLVEFSAKLGNVAESIKASLPGFDDLIAKIQALLNQLGVAVGGNQGAPRFTPATKGLVLTDEERRKREREIDDNELDIEKIKKGSFREKGESKSIRQKAAEEARRQIAELRKKGYQVDADEQKRIFDEIFRKMQRDATEPRKKRIGELRGELDEDKKRRDIRDMFRRTRGAKRRRKIGERNRAGARSKRRLPRIGFDGDDPIGSGEPVDRRGKQIEIKEGMEEALKKVFEGQSDKLSALVANGAALVEIGASLLNGLGYGEQAIAATGGRRA